MSRIGQLTEEEVKAPGLIPLSVNRFRAIIAS